MASEEGSASKDEEREEDSEAVVQECNDASSRTDEWDSEFQAVEEFSKETSGPDPEEGKFAMEILSGVPDNECDGPESALSQINKSVELKPGAHQGQSTRQRFREKHSHLRVGVPGGALAPGIRPTYSFHGEGQSETLVFDKITRAGSPWQPKTRFGTNKEHQASFSLRLNLIGLARSQAEPELRSLQNTFQQSQTERATKSSVHKAFPDPLPPGNTFNVRPSPPATDRRSPKTVASPRVLRSQRSLGALDAPGSPVPAFVWSPTTVTNTETGGVVLSPSLLKSGSGPSPLARQLVQQRSFQTFQLLKQQLNEPPSPASPASPRSLEPWSPPRSKESRCDASEPCRMGFTARRSPSSALTIDIKDPTSSPSPSGSLTPRKSLYSLRSFRYRGVESPRGPTKDSLQKLRKDSFLSILEPPSESPVSPGAALQTPGTLDRTSLFEAAFSKRRLSRVAAQQKAAIKAVDSAPVSDKAQDELGQLAPRFRHGATPRLERLPVTPLLLEVFAKTRLFSQEEITVRAWSPDPKPATLEEEPSDNSASETPSPRAPREVVELPQPTYSAAKNFHYIPEPPPPPPPRLSYTRTGARDDNAHAPATLQSEDVMDQLGFVERFVQLENPAAVVKYRLSLSSHSGVRSSLVYFWWTQRRLNSSSPSESTAHWTQKEYFSLQSRVLKVLEQGFDFQSPQPLYVSLCLRNWRHHVPPGQQSMDWRQFSNALLKFVSKATNAFSADNVATFLWKLYKRITRRLLPSDAEMPEYSTQPEFVWRDIAKIYTSGPYLTAHVAETVVVKPDDTAPLQDSVEADYPAEESSDSENETATVPSDPPVPPVTHRRHSIAPDPPAERAVEKHPSFRQQLNISRVNLHVGPNAEGSEASGQPWSLRELQTHQQPPGRQLLKHGHLTKSMMAFEGRQPILLTKVPVEHQSQLGPWGGMKISQAEPELPDAEAARPMAPDDRANVNYWTQSPRLVLKRGGPSFKSAQLTGQGVPAMHARRPIVPEPTSTSRVPVKESEHEGQSQQGLTVSIPVSNLAIGVNQTQNQASSPRLLIQSPPTHRRQLIFNPRARSQTEELNELCDVVQQRSLCPITPSRRERPKPSPPKQEKVQHRPNLLESSLPTHTVEIRSGALLTGELLEARTVVEQGSSDSESDPGPAPSGSVLSKQKSKKLRLRRKTRSRVRPKRRTVSPWRAPVIIPDRGPAADPCIPFMEAFYCSGPSGAIHWVPIPGQTENSWWEGDLDSDLEESAWVSTLLHNRQLFGKHHPFQYAQELNFDWDTNSAGNISPPQH